jgi:hypothetical protein
MCELGTYGIFRANLEYITAGRAPSLVMCGCFPIDVMTESRATAKRARTESLMKQNSRDGIERVSLLQKRNEFRMELVDRQC